jgi:hypothetical protein
MMRLRTQLLYERNEAECPRRRRTSVWICQQPWLSPACLACLALRRPVIVRRLSWILPDASPAPTSRENLSVVVPGTPRKRQARISFLSAPHHRCLARSYRSPPHEMPASRFQMLPPPGTCRSCPRGGWLGSPLGFPKRGLERESEPPGCLQAGEKIDQPGRRPRTIDRTCKEQQQRCDAPLWQELCC